MLQQSATAHLFNADIQGGNDARELAHDPSYLSAIGCSLRDIALMQLCCIAGWRHHFEVPVTALAHSKRCMIEVQLTGKWLLNAVVLCCIMHNGRC